MNPALRILIVAIAALVAWMGVATILNGNGWWLALSLFAAAVFCLLASVPPRADRDASAAAPPSAVRNPGDVVEADVAHPFPVEP